MSPRSAAESERLRRRARLLEFLKFRVLASQEAFFAAWIPDGGESGDGLPGDGAAAFGLAPAALAELDLAAFRAWLQPLWPEARGLEDEDLRHGLEQAFRLYVDRRPGGHPH